jgi:hypothetical protein
MPFSLAPYYIRFGEEFSRISALTSVANGTGANAGKLRITTPYQHNLTTGDRVQLIGTSISSYNNYSPVVVLNTTQFIMTDINFTSAASVSEAYFIQGEAITGWGQYTGADGAFYLRLTVKPNSTFNVGDLIQIRQDRKNQSGTTVAVVNSNYENVEWTIVSKVSASSYTYLNTNVPYGINIASNIFGSVISRNNYVIFNQISTQNDNSYTFGGVAQYDTFLTYSIAPYVFSSTQSQNQFLSLNNREIDICRDEYFTLPYMGTNIIKIIQPTNIGSRRIRIETHSTPNGLTYSASSISSDSSVSSGRLGLSFSQNLSTHLTEGSELTLFHNSGQLNTTILKSTTTSGLTSIILDTPYVLYSGSYILITTKIKRYDALMAQNMAQIGVGPKNLNLASTEINDGSCFKYKVYSILYGANNFLSTIWSETWTFNIKENCCKEKWQICFLGEMGTFEYFTFDGRLDESRSIEKQDWRRHLKEYRAGSGYSYAMRDRGITTYNTKSFEEWTLRSRFLNQKELDFLSYIYESPEVYLINDGNLIPITLIDSEVNLFNKRNVGEMGRIYYYTITFRLSNDRVIQRG